MSTENCEHGNAAPRDMIAGLQDSQAGAGRHKCAVCAYQEGFKAGRASLGKWAELVAELPEMIATVVKTELAKLPPLPKD